jgi:hypothetical protein
MGEDSAVCLTVEYGADVLPEDLAFAGAYDTGGGESSEGEIGYTRPPASARHVWFDFYATTDEDHRACRLTTTSRPGECGWRDNAVALPVPEPRDCSADTATRLQGLLGTMASDPIRQEAACQTAQP